jgi:hypothetical protein
VASSAKRPRAEGDAPEPGPAKQTHAEIMAKKSAVHVQGSCSLVRPGMFERVRCRHGQQFGTRSRARRIPAAPAERGAAARPSSVHCAG